MEIVRDISIERQMKMTCTAYSPPRRVEWHEDDGVDAFDVIYELEDRGAGATFMPRRAARRSARPAYCGRSTAAASAAT